LLNQIILVMRIESVVLIGYRSDFFDELRFQTHGAKSIDLSRFDVV